MIGQSIGHYEITDKIGAGGMGEVYRATDTRLNRQVALKVLPPIFAQDPHRMGRFRREAQVLASLNHPNIASIYGLEEANGTKALAMELVEGEDLSERIARGPIPLEKALPIALQIAEALEAAHEKGIIHRDLKPANIKITPEGQVKVLDFGLAKAVAPSEESNADLSNSPTLTAHATQIGMILGTAAYMSPEQARGRPVDRRSDVWAFGVVLYEMLTCRRPFVEGSTSETLAAILKEDPDWSQLPNQMPYRIRDLIEHCLRKDPHSRVQAIGDVRLTIEEYLADPKAVPWQLEIPPPGTPAGWKRTLPWVLVGLMTIVAATLLVVQFGETRERSGLVRARFTKPEDLTFQQADSPVVISPDGRLVVVSGFDEDGVNHLWLRKMDSQTFQKLGGTGGAGLAFWSPDSRFIGFFAQRDEKLKKVAVSGGLPIALADASYGGGGTWSREGIILFSPDPGGGPLYRVSSAGGEAKPVTVLEKSRQESSHQFPHFLPDGDHFLYAAFSSRHPTVIKLGSVTTGESRVLLDESMASGPAPDRGVTYAPPGYLLFKRLWQSTLMAQAFDAGRLEVTGEPFPLVEGLFRVGYQNYSASENGVLVYRGATKSSRLTWWDRAGRRLDSVADPAAYSQIALSPDEKYVSVGFDKDIWLLELSSGVFSRLTVDPASDSDAVWSPDSRQLLFTSDRNRTGTFNLFVKSIGGSEAKLLFEEDASQWSEDWSPDGRQVIYISNLGRSVYGLDLRSPDRQPKLLFESNFETDEHHVSPDGQWIAYGSRDSGTWEVQLATFPNFAKTRQVSVGGGLQPLWRRDGRELFYLHPDGRLMSVEVKLGADAETGAPQVLFQTGIAVNPLWNQYCVTADGQRFLTVVPEESEQIELIVNWHELLPPTSQQ